jgi:hypothetical protein
MKTIKIAVLAGDGIGPEVMREAIKVLRVAGKKFGFELGLTEAPVGWAGIDASGKALPDATLALCRNSEAILFGSVGLPDRDPAIPKEERPERAALLRIRKEFGLFANLRPVRLPKALAHACPLRPERQGDGIDILVVRELTGGMYFGQPKKTEEIPGGHRAIDTMVYTTPEIERIAHVAFRAARLRRKKVTSIDKANVLENGVLWREVGHAHRPPVFRRGPRTHVCGQRFHAAYAPAGAIRRDALREHVRRHSERRGGGAGGIARHAAQRQPRGDPRRNHLRLLRAGRRQRPGHRGQKPGQSHRPNPVRRADAAAQLRPEQRGGGD